MPSTRDIRRRIKSVKSTAQITKAMQMVASSKMAKAQAGAVNYRPFAAMASDIMGHLALDIGDYKHPLMEVRPVKKRLVIVISTDKGLCGALNTNLLREVSKYDTATTEFVAAGRKGAQFLARTKRKLVGEFTYHDTPTYGESADIARFAVDAFMKGEVDTVEVAYTRFINTLSQRPDMRVLLPMGSVESLRVAATGKTPEELQSSSAEPMDFIYEPNASSVMDHLILYFIDFRIAQLVLEAKASEHSARMVAMKNATDNANQLVKHLTLEYNKMRQASITKELLEISSAAMALG